MKTHHELNINTNVIFVLEHNISSPSKTQKGAWWTPICWLSSYILPFLPLCLTPCYWWVQVHTQKHYTSVPGKYLKKYKPFTHANCIKKRENYIDIRYILPAYNEWKLIATY